MRSSDCLAEENMACPQCGNPQLDVDAENSVVFCKKCGFAVRVDPATGNVTPIQTGGPAAQAPAVYHEKSILGMDPLTFWMGGTAVILLATIFGFFRAFGDEITTFGTLEILLTALWLLKK
ncbi:MAG: hypothetical protein NTY90_03855 [Candidatus Micrarchaeota archaeon]|nr:hypothetical protein [Candidatus Micrarchaeota archaeon]